MTRTQQRSMYAFLAMFHCIAVHVCALPAVAQQSITAETLSDEHVGKAIDAIVEELYQRAAPERFWDPAQWVYREHGESSQSGGFTALVVLALLYAGESYQSPRLRDAIDYLSEFNMEGTYARALRAHIWASLPARFRPQLTADTKWLLDGFVERVSGWMYKIEPNPSRRQDNSLRQYGTLGLWEAAKRGAEIDSRIWRMLEEAIIESQLADGGWNYRADASPPTGSMTTAGLTILFITQDFLHGREHVRLGQRQAGRHERAIQLGLDWMDRNFTPLANPGRDADYYYYMYGVERVGLASGYKYFGQYDWFRAGSVELLRRLCRWDPETRTMTVHRNIAGDGRAGRVRTRDLAFSLMFLSRGRVPVAINKLAIDEHPWNNRPRDVANLTAHVQELTETPMIWQIVNMNLPVEEWLDSSLLYLASSAALPWLTNANVNVPSYVRSVLDHMQRRAAGDVPIDAPPPARPQIPEVEKLKQYIDLGGTLFVVNEGGGDAFARSIEQVGLLMYPQYEWRDVLDDHSMFSAVPMRGRLPRMRALSNGVRELIILSRTDIAEVLQARDERQLATMHAAANVYLYASEMNRARPRLETQVYAQTTEKQAERRATLVRAMHKGNWNAEPLAYDVLRHYLLERRDLELQVISHPLETIHELSPRPALVHVSGIEAQEFSDKEQQAIRRFVQSGGYIMFETPGGIGEFTLSAEQMAAALFNQPIVSLLRHPLVTGEQSEAAADLSRVSYRPFAFEQFGSRELTPRLRAMMIDDQPRVLFSREDISHGLLDQPSWRISGYAAESARGLMGNIIEYAMPR